MLKPEQVPICVRQKLRRMVYDFETNEAVLIAAAINAWPDAGISQFHKHAIILLLTENTDDKA